MLSFIPAGCTDDVWQAASDRSTSKKTDLHTQWASFLLDTPLSAQALSQAKAIPLGTRHQE